jgi:hypothetical protein
MSVFKVLKLPSFISQSAPSNFALYVIRITEETERILVVVVSRRHKGNGPLPGKSKGWQKYHHQHQEYVSLDHYRMFSFRPENKRQQTLLTIDFHGALPALDKE